MMQLTSSALDVLLHLFFLSVSLWSAGAEARTQRPMPHVTIMQEGKERKKSVTDLGNGSH